MLAEFLRLEQVFVAIVTTEQLVLFVELDQAVI